MGVTLRGCGGAILQTRQTKGVSGVFRAQGFGVWVRVNSFRMIDSGGAPQLRALGALGCTLCIYRASPLFDTASPSRGHVEEHT